jgi:TATA-box binding protein (TBP) (component of TFIID and TFIIIB)
MDTFEYIKTLSKFRDEMEDQPSWVRITTITMMAKGVLGTVDARMIRKVFKAIGGSITVYPKGSKKGFEWKIRPSKRGSNFYNCISIGYADCYTTKAIKLFSNGSIQVAGCSNVLDCKRVVAQLAIVLPLILNKSLDIRYDLFKIVMINTNFSLNKTLNLYSVVRSLNRNETFKANYDPGSYAAVTVKFQPQPEMKRITVAIFSTGNIIITGAETLMEIAHAYKMINENIGSECRIKETDIKQDFGVTMGASFEEWLRVLNVV